MGKGGKGGGPLLLTIFANQMSRDQRSEADGIGIDLLIHENVVPGVSGGEVHVHGPPKLIDYVVAVVKGLAGRGWGEERDVGILIL